MPGTIFSPFTPRVSRQQGTGRYRGNGSKGFIQVQSSIRVGGGAVFLDCDSRRVVCEIRGLRAVERAAVDHYLTHGRRAPHVRQMGYPPSPWPRFRGIETGCGPEGRVRRIEFARGRGGGGRGFMVVRNWKRQLLGDAKGLMVAKREPERGDSSQQDDPDALRGEDRHVARRPRASARRTAGHEESSRRS